MDENIGQSCGNDNSVQDLGGEVNKNNVNAEGDKESGIVAPSAGAGLDQAVEIHSMNIMTPMRGKRRPLASVGRCPRK